MTTLGRAKRPPLFTFLIKYEIIASATSKSAITPSFIGRMASICAGVLPSMERASAPTAWTTFRPFRTEYATTDGSLRTTSRPLA